ncbi:MAG TPA: 6-phosphogluconolactonase [Verrucomicrobiae bacterium]|nr:6-phosphogluconolactonase [Verrucomicrobiae bacterium]
MGKVDLVRFDSAEALAQGVAGEWLQLAALSRAQPQYYAAFSGGRIAEGLFVAITSKVRQCNGTLAGVRFFWADERCVPPDDPESNYQLMRTHLLEPLQIPDAQVHRIKGELGPTAAAREASKEFADTVPRVLDFVFLGMGEDGHIASIFPGDRLQESSAENYCPVFNAPKLPRERVTLAMHAIIAAANVWVLVTGSGKQEALGKSLKGSETPLGHLLQARPFTRIFTNITPK